MADDYPFRPVGSTLLIEPDEVFLPTPLHVPDVTAGRETPESGIIRAMGATVDVAEFKLGARVGFHQRSGYNWADNTGKKWLVLDSSEVRLHLPADPLPGDLLEGDGAPA